MCKSNKQTGNTAVYYYMLFIKVSDLKVKYLQPYENEDTYMRSKHLSSFNAKSTKEQLER